MSNLLKCPITHRKMYFVDKLPGVHETKVYRSTDRKGRVLIYKSFMYNDKEFYQVNYFSNIRYFQLIENEMIEFQMSPSDYFEMKTIQEDSENMIHDIQVKLKLMQKKITNLINREFVIFDSHNFTKLFKEHF